MTVGLTNVVCMENRKIHEVLDHRKAMGLGVDLHHKTGAIRLVNVFLTL